MLGTLKSLLGLGPKVDYKTLVKEGAIVLDVRSAGEFSGGHVKGAINIPVDALKSNLKRLDKNKVIITCCASGMRSAAAKSVLKANGYANVHNGGGWMSLNNKL